MSSGLFGIYLGGMSVRFVILVADLSSEAGVEVLQRVAPAWSQYCDQGLGVSDDVFVTGLGTVTSL